MPTLATCYNITNTIPLLLAVIGIISFICVSPNLNSIFTFGKIYAVPLSVQFACLAFTLAVMSIGYITNSVNQRYWIVSYSIYYSFVAIFYIILIIVLHKRNTFAHNQMENVVIFDNYEYPYNYSTPYQFITGNLTCWGYNGCAEEECNSSNFNMTTTPNDPRCEDAAKKIYRKNFAVLFVINYLTLLFVVLHIVELVIRIFSFRIESSVSDSAALSRFVQLT